MDKVSTNSTKGPQPIPKKSRWDAASVLKHDHFHDDPRRSNDQTPLRV